MHGKREIIIRDLLFIRLINKVNKLFSMYKYNLSDTKAGNMAQLFRDSIHIYRIFLSFFLQIMQIYTQVG